MVLTEGSGEELRQGGTVSFYYAGYIFSGSSAPTASNLFATNREETATESGWTLTSPDYGILTLTLDEDAGLVEGLMKEIFKTAGKDLQTPFAKLP